MVGHVKATCQSEATSSLSVIFPAACVAARKISGEPARTESSNGVTAATAAALSRIMAASACTSFACISASRALASSASTSACSNAGSESKYSFVAGLRCRGELPVVVACGIAVADVGIAASLAGKTERVQGVLLETGTFLRNMGCDTAAFVLIIVGVVVRFAKNGLTSFSLPCNLI